MNFERIFNRRADGSIKWNKYPENIIPLWVADMDFEVSKPIKNALKQFIETGVYGYAGPSEELTNCIIRNFEEKYKWKIKREWIVWSTSVVSSIYVTAKMISDKPYAVMTSVPVYQPFLEAAKTDGRFLQAVPLKFENEKWQMDFEEMEKQRTADTKLYILCNPHNPVGRMFDKEELLRLSDFCVKSNILLCSDEIHCDVILDESKEHFPVASLSASAAMNTISLFAPGKAYNVAGINSCFAIIPNKKLKEKFEKTKNHLVPYTTKLAGDVALAAYSESGDWLKESLKYLRANQEFLFAEINKIDGLKMRKPEATYLAWIDYSGLGIDNFAELLEKHGVGVMESHIFMGKSHIRLNFGTQRCVLEEAVKRIRAAVEGLR